MVHSSRSRVNITHSRAAAAAAAAAATAAASAAVTRVLRLCAVKVAAADDEGGAVATDRTGPERRWRRTRACSGRMAVRFAPVGG